MKRLRAISGAVAVCAVVVFTARATAQSVDPAVGQNEVFVGSELEEYIRYLQADGRTPAYPWSSRSFSPGEVARLLPADSIHPWSARYPLRPDSGGGLRVELVRPRVRMVYNSAFPYGDNDGAVWAGRGLTTMLQAGLSARYGWASITVAPTVFRAENASFALIPNGESGRFAYADAWLPENIDRPQRFGDGPYARLDPGQSTIRIDAPGAAVGVSTANMQWGPASEYPLILGNNGPGFPHAFVGTAHPLSVGIGRVHGRLVWGRLEGSPYAIASPDSTVRFMSGLVAVFTPRGLAGLELGAARFFHSPWPADGLALRDFGKPVERLFKHTLPENGGEGDGRSSLDNQLASIFARWVFPASALELYAEYAREDHSWDLRDFFLEPDQNAGFLIGLRKAWVDSPTRWVAVRGELVNTQASHLSQVRAQAPFYKHNTYGHTVRGQILGAPAAYGGGGAIIGVDRYHERGRWTLEWTRTLNDPLATWHVSPRGPDVSHTLGAEALFFRGRWDVNTGLTGVYDLNRGLRSDEFNLNLVVGIRADL